MTAPDASPAAGVGELLRAGRERAGLSLEQVAAELHLKPEVIRALEADDDAALPEPPYVRGYLRAYAKLAGLQEAELLERYRARHPEPAEPVLTARERPSVDGPPAVRRVAVALVALAVLAGGLWWYAGGPRSAPPPPGGEGPGVEAAEPVPAAPDRPRAAAEAPPAPAAPIEYPPLLPEERAEPADAPLPGAAARAPTEAPTGAPEAPAAGPLEAPAPPPAEPPPGGDDRLELTFLQDSWAEVEDAHGVQLLYGLVSAGQRRSLRGAAPFRVMLGNAPGVEVSVNGQAVDFSTRVRADNTVRFRAPQ